MEQPSIKKNYLYKLLYEIFSVIAPLITAPYISRVLGADGIGIYSYTSSIMSYFTMFAILGTSSYGAREIAMHRNNKEEFTQLFWELEFLTVFTTTICIMGWTILILFSKEYKYYFIALIPLLFATMIDVSWFFTGMEKINSIVMRNILCKSVGIVCLFFFVNTRTDLIIYIVLNSAINLAGNFTMWIPLFQILGKIHIRQLHIFRHLQQTIIYFVPTIAISIYTVLDKTLIGIITNDVYENGYYEQATKIMTIIKSGSIQALNSVMGARIAFLFSENRFNEIYIWIDKSINYIFFLGYGCTFGLLAISKDFVTVFFGNGYEPVVFLLYIMAPLIIIIAISSIIGAQYLTPCGKQKLAGKLLVVGSIVNLLLNLLLIPQLGAKGATIATLIAETVITLLFIRESEGNVTIKIIWKYSWKRIVAGLLMVAIVLLFAENSNFDFKIKKLGLEILIGTISYIGGLLMMKDEFLIYMIREVKKRIHI